MIGFVIGTLCLLGFVKVLRGGCHGAMHGGHGGWYARRACGGGACGGGACGGGDHDGGFEGGPRGWRGMRRWWLRGLFERLDTTPGQEKAVMAALDEVREATRAARDELKGARGAVAKAMRAEPLDREALAEATARAEAAGAKVRDAATAALTSVHEALDERQRAMLADLVERGGGPFGRGAGPYRAWG